MLFTVLFAICLPASIAVGGAIWYHRLQWQQHYQMKSVIEAEAEADANIDEEEDVHLGKEASKDRRPRNVLLVDIEQLGTASGLWKIERATDLAHGQQLLAEGQFDIVVLPLAAESGIFLKWAASNTPTVCRAIQCDDEPPTEVFTLAPDAHLFLRKGSPPSVIQEQMLRGTALDVRKIEAALSRHFGSLANLPALPATFARAQKELMNPNCSLDKVSEIISQDLGLSAKVLQLVNAALVNTRQPIVQVQHAVKLVGLRGLRDLCLSVEVMQDLTLAAPHLKHFLEETQLRSLRAAKLALRVAGGGAEGDDAYSACLFHGIGQATLMAHAYDIYEQVEMVHLETGLPIEEVERDILGLTQNDVTAYLLRLWGLPYPVVEAVQYWRTPASVEHYKFSVLDAVHVSLNLVLAYESGDIRNAALDHDLLYALHRARSVNKWQIFAATICDDLDIIPSMVQEKHA